MADITYRCKTCRKSVILEPGVERCTECGAPLPGILKGTVPDSKKVSPKAAVASTSNKKRLRNARVLSTSRTTSTNGKGSNSRGRAGTLEQSGSSLIMHWLDGSSTERVSVRGDVEARFLLGTPFRWTTSAGAVPGQARSVRPVECVALDHARMRARATATKTVSSGDGTRFPAVVALPAGRSELELVADPLELLDRIAQLASEKDDPQAWATLANGYRLRQHRRAIEDALRAVGTDKVHRLVTSNPGPWPDGLTEFLQAEERRRRNAGRDGSITAAAYRHGDYGTVDD